MTPVPESQPPSAGRVGAAVEARAGAAVSPPAAAPSESAAAPARRELVTVWPHLFFREVLAALLCVIVLSLFALLRNAPLDDPADALRTPNPAKAPWYFVGFQELLGSFDPWIAGVAIPALVILGLCAIPYLDPKRTGEGVYTVRERPLASAIFIAGTVGWFVLIAIGMWFRGPEWRWVWPWAGPAPAAAAAPAVRALPNAIGVPLVLLSLVGGGWWIMRWTAAWPGLTPGRRRLFAFLLLAFAGTALKILLKLVFGLQYLVRFDRVGFNL